LFTLELFGAVLTGPFCTRASRRLAGGI
jgi:hypothetical protein